MFKANIKSVEKPAYDTSFVVDMLFGLGLHATDH